MITTHMTGRQVIEQFVFWNESHTIIDSVGYLFPIFTSMLFTCFSVKINALRAPVLSQSRLCRDRPNYIGMRPLLTIMDYLHYSAVNLLIFNRVNRNDYFFKNLSLIAFQRTL